MMRNKCYAIQLMILLILIHLSVVGQIADDFADGNFTVAPAWVGDTDSFIINNDFQLQLNATGSETCYLSVPCVSQGTMEWDMWVRLSFSPSLNNFARIYLLADRSNLVDTLNGYFLQLGAAGSDDALELFKQSGGTITSLCSGTGGLIAEAFAIDIKIKKTDDDEWKIYCKPDTAWEYFLEAEGTAIDTTQYSFFGVMCKFTSSNSRKFYFDDFYAGPFIIDTVSPVINKVRTMSNRQLNIVFSEPVQETGSADTIHYVVSKDFGHPFLVARDEDDPGSVYLTFARNFMKDTVYELQVSGVCDLEGNVINPCAPLFSYHRTGSFDVVINEIMADPSPTMGLPEAEYIELLNRSPVTVNLSGWMMDYGTSSALLPDVNIDPGGFILITKGNDLSEFGPVIEAFTSSSSLSNEGSTITLRDAEGQIIHSVSYSADWYKEDYKNDGGWSLEQIDPDNPCGEASNWDGSVDISGGTPGRINSIYSINPDTTPPRLYGIAPINPWRIMITFTEKMDSLFLSDPMKYFINNDIGYPVGAHPVSPGYRSVVLDLSKSLSDHTLFHLYFMGALFDCSGNPMVNNDSSKLALAGLADQMDMVINEILTDPFAGGSDFVEIYNRSALVFDLKDYVLASFDTMTSMITSVKTITEQGYLIFPGDYLVLTPHPDDIKSKYVTPNQDGFITMASFPDYHIDKGIVVLARKNDGLIIDKLTYSPELHFALLNSTKGVTLERIHFDRPTEDPTNWHSAAQSIGYGTPGYKNSQFCEFLSQDDPITITPQLFSPDNDGNQDVLNIQYNMDESGYVASINIFDAYGQAIRHLVNNFLVGNTGTFSWDGRDDKGVLAQDGIYIILFETYNLKGIVKKYKKVCVLARRL